jgi:hypothetical protein
MALSRWLDAGAPPHWGREKSPAKEAAPRAATEQEQSPETPSTMGATLGEPSCAPKPPRPKKPRRRRRTAVD